MLQPQCVQLSRTLSFSSHVIVIIVGKDGQIFGAMSRFDESAISQHDVLCRELLRDAADGIKLAMQRDLVDVCEVAGFVDTLLSTPSPFSEEKLGGGPWQVAHCMPHARVHY
jgi:hypothetical protein